MLTWIYIVAIAGEQEDDPISFEHTILQAENEHRAYSIGQRETAFAHKGRMLNDYVVNFQDVLVQAYNKGLR